MQLLVSVANAADARRAVNGGADLIDAKDPLTGALGAVALETLADIHSAVAGTRVVTAALGDAVDEEAVARTAFEYAATGVGFVKVGFAGITEPSRVERLVAAAAMGVTRARHRTCGVVAVAYADTGGTTSVDRDTLVDAAARSGAAGVLLDTALKHRPGLRHLMPVPAIEQWVRRAHEAGLIVALAGRLTAGDLAWVDDTGADIAGVRGAACEGGRSSSIVEERVRMLRQALRSVMAVD
jgi:(5-formylfuran-3-yl)methyl phosphate synthase